MSSAAILEVVGGLVAFDVTTADREALRSALTASKDVVAWCQALDVRVAAAMDATEPFREQAISEAQAVPFRDAERLVQRADVLARAPALARALEEGRIAVAHVDVIARALKRLEPAGRSALLAQADSLVAVAERVCPDTFQRKVKERAQRLLVDGGMGEFEAQRRATTLRSWTDERGMWCLHGEFDPLSGKLIAAALRGKLEALFHDTTPASAPSDPLARQEHLAALALIDLLTTPGAGGQMRWAVTAVVDVSDQPTEIDWGLPIDIPDQVRDALFRQAAIECIIVANGHILLAPGRADEGRHRRVATRAQRRMLQALYRCCAVPGCTVPFDRAKIHHIVPWESGGPTNLHNLIPLCVRHHHYVHDDGWHLTLADDRSLIVTRPDGRQLTTGPPRRRPAA